MFRSLPAVVIAVATLFGVVAEASAGWGSYGGGSYGAGSWGAGSYGAGRWGSAGSAPFGSWGSWGTGLGLHRHRSYGHHGYGRRSYGYGSYGYSAYGRRSYAHYGYGGAYYRSGYTTAASYASTGYNYYTARPAYRATYTTYVAAPVYNAPVYSAPVYSTPVYAAPAVVSSHVVETPVYNSVPDCSGCAVADAHEIGNGYVTGEVVYDGVISGGVISGCNNGIVHEGVFHSDGGYVEGAVIDGSVLEDDAKTPAPAADADAADDAKEDSLPAPDDASTSRKDEAMLTISVPADAKIFVNGKETRTEGGKRTYVSRDLKEGYSYAYDVEARWERNGETLTEKRHVDLRAGVHETVQLDFADAIARQDAKAEKVETVLSLRVPADAQVKLAGHSTKGEGPVRIFKTRVLADGQQWKDYKIQVSVNRNGHAITKSKVITLGGGEDRNFVFDFSANEVADNR